MNAPEHRIESLLLHDGFVRALARSLLADRHAADDVAQETWVAALERGDAAASLPRWLAGVVKHLAGKVRRSEHRRERRPWCTWSTSSAARKRCVSCSRHSSDTSSRTTRSTRRSTR